MEQPMNEVQKLARERLRFYAVGSFINTGAFMLVYGLGLLSMLVVRGMPFEEYEVLFTRQIAGMVDADQLPRVEEMLILLHTSGVALMVILFLRTVLRFMGVLMMWRGMKQGFHLYAFAQLAGIFAPHIVLPWSYLGVWGPLAAVGMTALYGMQIKQLPEMDGTPRGT